MVTILMYLAVLLMFVLQLNILMVLLLTRIVHINRYKQLLQVQPWQYAIGYISNITRDSATGVLDESPYRLLVGTTEPGSQI